MSLRDTYFVYILECADGTFYTGQTKNLENRLKLHATGRGAKYVKGRTPFDLIYTETFPTRGDAMRREMEIKKFSKNRKTNLVDTDLNEINGIEMDFLQDIWN